MIREFLKEDYEDYLKLSTEFYNSHAVIEKIPKENFKITFNDIINKTPYMKGFIVEYENKSVGYALISLTKSNEAGGLVVWVEEVYISKSYQSKGLGKEFFEYIEKAYKNVAKRFRLEVSFENEKVQNYYAKLGFNKLSYKQMYK